jgi:hypothetical protein
LLGSLGKLVPDVEPVTVLAINALTSNLDLDLGNQLLSNKIEPSGIDSVIASGLHALVNLRKSHLEVCAVGKVSISGDGAGHTSSKVGLSGECLLDRLHRKVGMASVGHLPESNLGGSGKEHILGAIGDELHQTTSHILWIILYPKKIILEELN